MELPGPLIEASFLKREGRFKGYVEVNGEVKTIHIHDPGRLPRLLSSGVEVLARPHSKEGLRTQLYLVAVRDGDCLVLVDSSLHVKIVEEAIQHGRIAELQDYLVVRREVRFKKGRVDLLLQSPLGKPALLEVKGCTLVEEGVALFPDAPTARGARHLEELTTALNEGFEAYILFLVPHCRAREFTPNFKVDPRFTQRLLEAADKGVKILAYKAEVKDGRVEVVGALPIKLEAPRLRPHQGSAFY